MMKIVRQKYLGAQVFIEKQNKCLSKTVEVLFEFMLFFGEEITNFKFLLTFF